MSETSSWQAPSWLTNKYLEDILKKFLKNETVAVEKVNVSPAIGKGENYSSVMSRIQIFFTTGKARQPEELSFIMKYSYESDPFLATIFNSYDAYNTEMKIYEHVLPQLVKLLRESGDSEKLSPETLHVDYEKSTIILEDLKVKNYVVADRQKGLDKQHCRLVLKKLAKFHAAAAVLNERLNGDLQKFDHGLYNKHARSLGRINENFMQDTANFAKECPELGEYYYDKISKLSPHLIEYCNRAYANETKYFCTLNHGDLWVNNLMILYDKAESQEKSLQDILLIDFQYSNWSSPAVDLHYFLNASLETKLQFDFMEVDGLIQYYHNVLSDTLRKLHFGGHIPTLHEIHILLEENKILAVNAALTSQVIMITDQSDDSNIHSFVGDDERSRNFRRNCFKNKRVQHHLKTWIPYFDRCGLLDLQK